MLVSYSFYSKSSSWPKNILQSFTVQTSISAPEPHTTCGHDSQASFNLSHFPLDETDKTPSPWGVSQLLLQDGGHIKGSSGFICFPSRDLELLRDPAAGRGQPWPLDWGGDSRILALQGSLLSSWPECSNVVSLWHCAHVHQLPKLLTLTDHL